MVYCYVLMQNFKEAHPTWVIALNNNEKAKRVFDSLSPSRQKEMVRYISNLKKEESVDWNVVRANKFSSGKRTFCRKG